LLRNGKVSVRGEKKNYQMETKKGQALIIGLVVLVVVVVGGFFLFNSPSDDSSSNNPTSQVPGNENVEETVVEEEEEEIDDNPVQCLTDAKLCSDGSTVSRTPPECLFAECPIVDEVQTKTFDITARQWNFNPSTITVNEGDNVVLNIESIDVNHGFFLSTFGVNELLSPGETTNIEFIADEKGSFSFFCNVFCGSGHGSMRGTLVVE